MIGPEEDDYKIMLGLADTLLRLKLVEAESINNSRMTSYIAVCNLGQTWWMEYRYEISN